MNNKKDVVQDQCSFCFKTRDEVVVLVRSRPVGSSEYHCICDECVEACQKVLVQEVLVQEEGS